MGALYCFYAVVVCFALSALVFYHAVIIFMNLTTNEHIRDYYTQKNPFDISKTENCRQVFCAPYGQELHIDHEFQTPLSSREPSKAYYCSRGEKKPTALPVNSGTDTADSTACIP